MSLRIMVVDDNDIARLLIAEMLASIGHEVVGQASTLKGAVDTYIRLRPDLVTLDIAMPDADGMKVLKALREVDPKAKVLIVSCNHQDSIYQGMMNAGAIGYLIKPITPERLATELKGLVGV